MNYPDQTQQQQGCPAIVSRCNGQGQVAHDRCHTKADLQDQGREQYRPRTAQHGAWRRNDQRQGKATQHGECHQCAQAMDEMDRHPPPVIQHATLVIDADSAPEDETFIEISSRPPRPVTGRKIGQASAA